MARIRRRIFLGGTAATGAAAIAPWGSMPLAGAATEETTMLTPDEGATLAAWCDDLVPGAAEAGVVAFVERCLAAPVRDCLLEVRCLANPPYDALYRAGLAGIEAEAQARFGAPYHTLGSDARKAVIEAAVDGKTTAWTAPAPRFFYFLTRSDAVDAVFGTEAGFRRLGIPYEAHILPEDPW